MTITPMHGSPGVQLTRTIVEKQKSEIHDR